MEHCLSFEFSFMPALLFHHDLLYRHIWILSIGQAASGEVYAMSHIKTVAILLMPRNIAAWRKKGSPVSDYCADGSRRFTIDRTLSAEKHKKEKIF